MLVGLQAVYCYGVHRQDVTGNLLTWGQNSPVQQSIMSIVKE